MPILIRIPFSFHVFNDDVISSGIRRSTVVPAGGTSPAREHSLYSLLVSKYLRETLSLLGWTECQLGEPGNEDVIYYVVRLL